MLLVPCRVCRICVCRALPCVLVQLIVMPRCGHVPHEEQAGEFIRVLLEASGLDGASVMDHSAPADPPGDGRVGA